MAIFNTIKSSASATAEKGLLALGRASCSLNLRSPMLRKLNAAPLMAVAPSHMRGACEEHMERMNKRSMEAWEQDSLVGMATYIAENPEPRKELEDWMAFACRVAAYRAAQVGDVTQALAGMASRAGLSRTTANLWGKTRGLDDFADALEAHATVGDCKWCQPHPCGCHAKAGTCRTCDITIFSDNRGYDRSICVHCDEDRVRIEADVEAWLEMAQERFSSSSALSVGEQREWMEMMVNTFIPGQVVFTWSETVETGDVYEGPIPF